MIVSDCLLSPLSPLFFFRTFTPPTSSLNHLQSYPTWPSSLPQTHKVPGTAEEGKKREIEPNPCNELHLYVFLVRDCKIQMRLLVRPWYVLVSTYELVFNVSWNFCFTYNFNPNIIESDYMEYHDGMYVYVNLEVKWVGFTCFGKRSKMAYQKNEE